jgi:exonuclease-1
MGIPNLMKFVEPACREGTVDEFRGKVVAVDASCLIHKALCTDQQCDIFILRYLKMLRQHDCQVLLVFDGEHWTPKNETRVKRSNLREYNKEKGEKLLKQGHVVQALKYFKRCHVVTPDIVQTIIKAVENKPDVEVIVAPYEADAQLAYLAKKGLAHVVVTEDSDLIAHGCEFVLFKLKLSGRCVIYEKSRLELSIEFSRFRQVCILTGCDYLPGGLKGYGLKKALQLLTSERDVKDILDALPKEIFGEITAEEFYEKFQVAEKSFLEQPILDPITNERKALNL